MSFCGSTHITNCKHPMPHRCESCRKHFSVRVGSILEDSKLPLQKLLLAIYILLNSKKGISSTQMSEYLGCTQKTAWFLASRIREAWFSDDKTLSGIVEVDETYIGGLEKNKHSNKKLRTGRGVVAKKPVFGVKERGGNVIAFIKLGIRECITNGAENIYLDTYGNTLPVLILESILYLTV